MSNWLKKSLKTAVKGECTLYVIFYKVDWWPREKPTYFYYIFWRKRQMVYKDGFFTLEEAFKAGKQQLETDPVLENRIQKALEERAVQNEKARIKREANREILQEKARKKREEEELEKERRKSPWGNNAYKGVTIHSHAGGESGTERRTWLLPPIES